MNTAQPLTTTYPRAGVVVAIDGPSGSGKSTIARTVAKRLGGRYLDTGAMYRALTWTALSRGIDVNDSQALIALAKQIRIEPPADVDARGLVVDGHHLDQELRGEDVTLHVSLVAKNLAVREVLVTQQRSVIAAAVAAGYAIVAEGRDITTVVAPDADVRVLLTASEQVRLERRAAELGLSPEQIEAQIGGRDRIDQTVNDLEHPAPGVTLIDSSQLDIGAVVARVLELLPAADATSAREGMRYE